MGQTFKVGEAPWEKQSGKSFAVGQAPWEKEHGSVVDEMHPDIGLWDRFKYKNLGTSVEEGLKFFQKEYPDLEFKADKENKILAKRKDETAWKRLDPTDAEFSDITDAIYDVGAGFAETTASALGGIAGAVGGTAVAPGVGTVAGGMGGAMAAGGAAGAGLEGLRQTLGQMGGVSEEYDPSMIGTGALFGAASPLLLGTGAAGKQVVKGVGKLATTGVGKQAQVKAGEKLLQQVGSAQQGLLGRGFRGARGYVAPRAGQMISGIEADTLRWAAKDLENRGGSKILAAQENYGNAEIFTNVKNEFDTAYASHKQLAGERYGEALEGLDVTIDVEKIEQPLQKLLASYEDKALKAIDKFGDAAENRVEVQNYEFLKKTLDEYAHGTGTLKGAEAQQYLDLMNDLTQVRKNVNVSGKEKVDRELINAAKQTTKNLDKEILAFDTGKVLKGAKDEYGKVIAQGEQLKKYFKDDDAAERTVNSLLSAKRNVRRRNILKLADDLDVDVPETARESIAAGLFANPSMDLTSIGGVTSTTRSVPLSIAGGVLGYSAGSQLGEGHGGGVAGGTIGTILGGKFGSPAAMRRAMELNAFTNRMGSGLQQMGPGALPALPQTGANIWKQLEQNRR